LRLERRRFAAWSFPGLISSIRPAAERCEFLKGILMLCIVVSNIWIPFKIVFKGAFRIGIKTLL